MFSYIYIYIGGITLSLSLLKIEAIYIFEVLKYEYVSHIHYFLSILMSKFNGMVKLQRIDSLKRIKCNKMVVNECLCKW
jgi:hypothetical protein